MNIVGHHFVGGRADPVFRRSGGSDPSPGFLHQTPRRREDGLPGHSPDDDRLGPVQPGPLHPGPDSGQPQTPVDRPLHLPGLAPQPPTPSSMPGSRPDWPPGPRTKTAGRRKADGRATRPGGSDSGHHLRSGLDHDQGPDVLGHPFRSLQLYDVRPVGGHGGGGRGFHRGRPWGPGSPPSFLWPQSSGPPEGAPIERQDLQTPGRRTGRTRRMRSGLRLPGIPRLGGWKLARSDPPFASLY